TFVNGPGCGLCYDVVAKGGAFTDVSAKTDPALDVVGASTRRLLSGVAAGSFEVGTQLRPGRPVLGLAKAHDATGTVGGLGVFQSPVTLQHDELQMGLLSQNPPKLGVALQGSVSVDIPGATPAHLQLTGNVSATISPQSFDFTLNG